MSSSLMTWHSYPTAEKLTGLAQVLLLVITSSNVHLPDCTHQSQSHTSFCQLEVMVSLSLVTEGTKHDFLQPSVDKF